MAYATVENYIEAFTESEAIQVSNLDQPSAVTVNESRIQVALDDASDVVDSYLYQYLPLNAIPRPVRRACLSIARDYLHINGVGYEKVAEDKKAAIKWLESVRDGKTSLGLDRATGDLLPSTGQAEVANTGSTIFAEALDGY